MKNLKPFNPQLRKMIRSILLVGLTLTLTLGLFDLGHLNSAADPTSPDFTINTNPSSLTIFIGACASKIINVTSINGFTGPVSLTTAVLPGFIATISPLGVNVPAGGSAFATKTVCVAPPIAPGSYPETVTGTSGALSHTITETDTVPSILSDFSITANPSSLTILSGSCSNKTIIITAIGNYSGTIALTTTVSGGLTAFLGAISVTLPPSPQTFLKTVCAPAAVPPGSYVETVTGTDLTGLSHSFNETDTVIGGPSDFTMVASTTSLTIPPNSCSSKTITITGVNNYTGTITLTTSIVPPGLTASLAPSTVSLPPSPQTVTKTVCASINTPPGVYTETVTGTDTSGLTHTINETDTVPPITTTPCFFFTLNGKPVSQKYCNPRANDLKIDFKPLASAGCFIQFTSNGVPNGIPLVCPPGANDIEIFWKITPTAATITRCIWTLNENRLPFPCPVPSGSNDFRFFAGGITQVFWTLNGVLLKPPILPPAAVIANDVDFFFMRAQPSTPCFFFTFNGQPASGNYCNSVANDLKIDFVPGGTCYIQYTFLGVPNGNPVKCPTMANDIDVVWKFFATGPVIVGCFWTFNETPLTIPCTVPAGSNGFRFFNDPQISQVFWTINLGMIMPAIIPTQPVNDVEFQFI